MPITLFYAFVTWCSKLSLRQFSTSNSLTHSGDKHHCQSTWTRWRDWEEEHVLAGTFNLFGLGCNHAFIPRSHQVGFNCWSLRQHGEQHQDNLDLQFVQIRLSTSSAHGTLPSQYISKSFINRDKCSATHAYSIQN